MSSIAMRNSFSVPSRMENGALLIWSGNFEARTQHYDDASMVPHHFQFWAGVQFEFLQG
jgi:hypothetical protein